MAQRSLGSTRRCSLARSFVIADGPHGIPDATSGPVSAYELEPRLARRAIDEERQAHALESARRVERAHADVAIGICLATRVDLVEHCGSIANVEHRQASHFPVGVAGMRIVRELHGRRPTLAQRVVDLGADLRVSEIRKKGERALSDTHRGAPESSLRRLPSWARIVSTLSPMNQFAGVAVGTKSTVSVEV